MYLEMSNNSSVIGAMLFAVDMLMRQVDWRVDAASDAAQDQQAAQLVEESLEDMSRSWQDTLSEILSFIVYGFSFHEILYKQRNGIHREPGLASRFNDGGIGWRKWPIRAQVTRWRWSFAPDGGVQGLWQIPPPDYVPRFVPIKKALLFRTQIHKDNPEGTSILRRCYIPWYYSKRIKEFEAIGVERNLDGLPVMYVPAELTHAQAGSDQATLYTSIKQLLRDVRRDAREGVIIPQSYDPETKQPLYQFELMSVKGRGRQVNTEEIVQRYNKEMALTMLADFLFIGQTNVGSRSLVESRSSLFMQAIGAWLDVICGVVNRHGIPRLIGLNGMKLEKLPVLAHGDIETVDPAVLGAAFQALANAGFDFANEPRLANWILKQMGAPTEVGGEIQEHLEEVEEERRELQAQQRAAESAAADAAAESSRRTADMTRAGKSPAEINGEEPKPANGGTVPKSKENGGSNG